MHCCDNAITYMNGNIALAFYRHSKQGCRVRLEVCCVVNRLIL